MTKPSERGLRILIGVLVATLTIVAVMSRTESAAIEVVEYPEFPKTAVYGYTAPPERAKIAPLRHSTDVSGNVALGEVIARENGIIGNEWECLYQLGMNESGWNHRATNPTSGAYGIPQSLPASKMTTHGDIHDPVVQIEWFIDYSLARYGSACGAYQFQVSNNWY